MDGRAFRSEQLQDPGIAPIPVVIVSAMGDVRQAAAELQVAAHVTKPLRLILEALLRPERELEVIEARGLVQRISYSSHVPSLADAVLYEPAIRAGLRGARRARRLQTGNVRTYALYLLALVLGLLALIRIGALG